jgi:hypothetical protein
MTTSLPQTAPVLETALQRLLTQVVINWTAFPQTEALETLLRQHLAEAAAADVEVLTVSTPVSRVRRLRLATVCGPASLDSFYSGEAAELSISDDGCCYLVYRRSDGGDYAVQWSSATAIPDALVADVPDLLATAMFDGRD